VIPRRTPRRLYQAAHTAGCFPPGNCWLPKRFVHDNCTSPAQLNAWIVQASTHQVFHDNTKAWSGDHCVDPSVVLGVLFANRPIEVDNPRLLNIGLTVLELFDVGVPDYMDCW
jgi:hypothetical protein